LEALEHHNPFLFLEKLMDLDREDRSSKKLLFTRWRSILVEPLAQ